MKLKSNIDNISKADGREVNEKEKKNAVKALKNFNRNRKKVLGRNTEKQNELRIKIKELEEKLDKEPEFVSKLKRLIGENYRKLNFMQKTYMDVVKILSRNIIYLMLPIFRKLYNNRRNDLKLMLEIICADGIIEETEDRIIIWLIISREYSPVQKKAVSEFLFILSCKVNMLYYPLNTLSAGYYFETNL